jgi:hypothetical protein
MVQCELDVRSPNPQRRFIGAVADTAGYRADQPTIPMLVQWSNNTCPPTSGSGPPAGCPNACLEGYLSPYAILAETTADVVAGVNYARQKKLRLIIRNTGHCFMGRSTGTDIRRCRDLLPQKTDPAVGYGALVINTHRLNSIKFETQCTRCDGHTGGVVKVGAGVMFKDLYAKAWPKNLDVLGGECPVSRSRCHIMRERNLTKLDRRSESQVASFLEVDRGHCLAFTELVWMSRASLVEAA